MDSPYVHCYEEEGYETRLGKILADIRKINEAYYGSSFWKMLSPSFVLLKAFTAIRTRRNGQAIWVLKCVCAVAAGL